MTPKVEVIETFKATRDGCDVNVFPQPTCPRSDKYGERSLVSHNRDRTKTQLVELATIRFGAFTATVLTSEVARLKKELPKRLPVSRRAAPGMPDFSLEARARWVTARAEARFAKARREDHAEWEETAAMARKDAANAAIDVTLPVAYPWGAR